MSKAFYAGGNPVIAQFSAKIFASHDPREMVAWRGALGEKEVWLHLDHCEDLDLLSKCAEAGFDSVMFDGSHYPLEENIGRSQAAVEAIKLHHPDVLVECEIGAVQGVEDGFGSEAQAKAPKVEEVLAFYETVRPDMLAVGFGNMHGHYKGNEVFDLELLRAVSERLPEVPLVLHGGSGMAMEIVRQLVEWGHCKLNISTDLKVFWMDLLREAASRAGELGSPIAVNAFIQIELERFFTELRIKYASCLR